MSNVLVLVETSEWMALDTFVAVIYKTGRLLDVDKNGGSVPLLLLALLVSEELSFTRSFLGSML